MRKTFKINTNLNSDEITIVNSFAKDGQIFVEVEYQEKKLYKGDIVRFKDNIYKLGKIAKVYTNKEDRIFVVKLSNGNTMYCAEDEVELANLKEQEVFKQEKDKERNPKNPLWDTHSFSYELPKEDVDRLLNIFGIKDI